MKYIYLIIGSLSVALGVAGVFLPVLLPAAPFLLLAAALSFRSSPRVYVWLLDCRYSGSYKTRRVHG